MRDSRARPRRLANQSAARPSARTLLWCYLPADTMVNRDTARWMEYRRMTELEPSPRDGYRCWRYPLRDDESVQAAMQRFPSTWTFAYGEWDVASAPTSLARAPASAKRQAYRDVRKSKESIRAHADQLALQWFASLGVYVAPDGNVGQRASHLAKWIASTGLPSLHAITWALLSTGELRGDDEKRGRAILASYDEDAPEDFAELRDGCLPCQCADINAYAVKQGERSLSDAERSKAYHDAQ